MDLFLLLIIILQQTLFLRTPLRDACVPTSSPRCGAVSDGHVCARGWVLPTAAQCPSAPAKWHLCQEQPASSRNLQAFHKPNSCLPYFSFMCHPQDLIYELKAVAYFFSRSELSSRKQDDALKRIVPHGPPVRSTRAEVPGPRLAQRFLGKLRPGPHHLSLCTWEPRGRWTPACVCCFAASLSTAVWSSGTTVFILPSSSCFHQGNRLLAILDVSC